MPLPSSRDVARRVSTVSESPIHYGLETIDGLPVVDYNAGAILQLFSSFYCNNHHNNVRGWLKVMNESDN